MRREFDPGKLPGIWRGFFDDKWHRNRPYYRHTLYNRRLHNIINIIGPAPCPRSGDVGMVELGVAYLYHEVVYESSNRAGNSP